MFQFHHAQLSNGLEVIAEVDDLAQSLAVGYMVKTGSRDEGPRVGGVSHFLEHMLFKGTPKRSSEDINRELDEMGAQSNAFTSNEVTCYWAHVLPEFGERALELLAALIRPTLRRADFAMEKKVILEEVSQYLDRPTQVLFEEVMADHFGAHPLAGSVLGTAESITALTSPRMRDYFQSRYGPSNMVLAVTGQVDFAAFMKNTERYCGSWSGPPALREYPPLTYTPSRRHIRQAKLKRHYIAMLCPGPSAQDERRYAAQVLADVLGDQEGSRLFWALVEPGLADEVEFSYFPHDGSGSFLAFASCDPARSQQVEEILLTEMKKAVDHGCSTQEVERSKNKIETATVLQGELPLGRMRNLAARWVYNHEYRTMEQDLALLEGIGCGDLEKVLKAFPFAPLTMTTMGPGRV